MRFELTVALKYLIPKWRQLSVSIISLVSILVISLVVWLVVLFLSVTDGIEKKWVEQLVALNAPVRMTPTEAYYRSYFYQIDSVSLDSNYTLKTIGEKLASIQTDPYDPSIDVELPYDFPTPDRREDGNLKDFVKEGWEAIGSLHEKGVRPQEYEVSFGNLRLRLLREHSLSGETAQTHLTQVSYIASHDNANQRLKKMILPPSAEDYNNFLNTLSQTNNYNSNIEEEEFSFGQEVSPSQLQKNLRAFFDHVEITKLQTTEEGFTLPASFIPEKGFLKGVGIIRHREIRKVVIPKTAQEISSLEARLKAFGFETSHVEIIFDQEQMHISSEVNPSQGVELVLSDKIPFKATLINSSIQTAASPSSLKFDLEGIVQGLPISGIADFEQLEILEAHSIHPSHSNSNPFWLYADHTGKIVIPYDQPFGDGILISKQFQSNGVHLGDQGYIAYYTPTASSTQEQRIPVYVAGFYDPGLMPIGNKLIFVDPKVSSLLRGNASIPDTTLGNGINIWLDDISEADEVKNHLIRALESLEIGKYWQVQSYKDYDFAKPVLQQLQSDKNLFTLIAVIILIVACSNIISMLILLVNDKKREIGILQSMGASPRRIATIFGLCGFIMGVISCVIGTFAAILTLRHLQSLVDLLSFLQGHEAFQAAFYGSHLPNELSFASLLFVIVATIMIALLAGIVPAIKAARIRPTEILRAE